MSVYLQVTFLGLYIIIKWFIVFCRKFTGKSHISQQGLGLQLKAKAENFGLKFKAKA